LLPCASERLTALNDGEEWIYFWQLTRIFPQDRDMQVGN
jgi:hypothetical protein